MWIFWWKDVLKLVDNFKGVATVRHRKGNTFLFWRDNWMLNGVSSPSESRYPRFFSYALDIEISVVQAFATNNSTSLFQLPLSLWAFDELVELQNLLQANPANDQDDAWVYC
jgi:hypothetical protein